MSKFLFKFRFWQLASWCCAWRPPHKVSRVVSLLPEDREVVVSLATCCQAAVVPMDDVLDRHEARARLDEAAFQLHQDTIEAHGGRERDHVVDLAGVGGDGA